jgi:hypothetical protein
MIDFPREQNDQRECLRFYAFAEIGEVLNNI